MNNEEITNRIFLIRGKEVMLDKDISILYGVSTKVLNQAVKRNINRFPQEFMFKLTTEETIFSRSQIVTLKSENYPKRGQNIKYVPHAFTEMGIAMLSAVLKSEIAVRVSIEIIQAFTEIRKNHQNILRITERIDQLEKKINVHELKIDQILDRSETPEKERIGIFFNDQIFDAYVFSSNLITLAKKSIVLIDNYIDENTLLQLSKRKVNVNCIIYTEKINPQLKLDLDKHNSQYPSIEIRIMKNVHDRFLILDNQSLYHIGASLKDLGKRWFAFSRMDGLIEDVMKRLP
jgi:phage regulator Rha-like protein